MGMFIGKMQERRAADAAAMERMVEYLEGEKCPEYLTAAHKISMGLQEAEEEDEEEFEDDDTAKKYQLELAGFDAEEEEDEDDEALVKDLDHDDSKPKDDEGEPRPDYPLHEAAATNSYYKVVHCLRNTRVSIELINPEGKTALYICCELGNPLTVGLLLQSGAKTYHKTSFGWVPMHVAVFCGHTRVVEILIEKNAATNPRDNMGVTPLMLIASSFRLYRDDFMTRADRTARERAKARYFDYEVQNRLLQTYGPKIDPVKTLDVLCKLRHGYEVYEEYERPRVLTFWEKRQGISPFELVRRKLDYQEEKQKANESVNRYWEYSQHRVELILVRSLEGRGMNKLDPNLCDRKGRTALMYCCSDGYLNIISRLIALRAQIDRKDNVGQTALFAACKNGQTQSLAMLLCAGAKVEVHDAFFTFPLHVVVDSGHEQMANMLIRMSASVNVYDSQGRSPLMFAMDTRNGKIVRQILEEHPELDVVDGRGWNIFIYAVQTQLLKELGEVLLGFGDEIKNVTGWKDPQGMCALHHAVTMGSFAEVELLTRILPNVTQGDCNDNTSLHLACQEGNGQILRHLLEFIFTDSVAYVIEEADEEVAARKKMLEEQRATAQAELRSAYGTKVEPIKTVKFHDFVRKKNERRMRKSKAELELERQLKEREEAALGQSSDAARRLSEMTVDFRNVQEETPLLLACSRGNMNCVLLLLDRRNPVVADASAVDRNGKNMLHHACSGRNLDLVNLLLVNKDCTSLFGTPNKHLAFESIDVNAQTNDGTTAAMIAARDGNWSLIPGLVLAGASLNMKDKDEYTALHWACHEGETACVATLLDCKANLNEVDAAGWTPMHLATHVGCNDAAQLLIDMGADLNRKTASGQTAYDLAREGAHAQLIEMDVEDGNFRALVDIICDGMRDHDLTRGLTSKQLLNGVDADGSIILSLLHGRHLACPGVDSASLNTYAYLQFAANPDENSEICMSSCCLGNPNPVWNETFSFQLKKLTQFSFLSIHFLGTQDTSQLDHMKEAMRPAEKEIGIDTAAAVDVGGIEVEDENGPRGASNPLNASSAAGGIGGAGGPAATEETEDYLQAFSSQLEADRAMFKADFAKPIPVRTMEDSVWLSLKNFHEVMRKRGYQNVAMPAVPKRHIPLGVIFLSFRTLRESLWQPGVFEFDRPLRMSQQGRIRFDLEFRPRFWNPRPTVDPSDLARFALPSRAMVEEHETFFTYKDGNRDYGNKITPIEEDPLRREMREIHTFDGGKLMFMPRQNRPRPPGQKEIVNQSGRPEPGKEVIADLRNSDAEQRAKERREKKKRRKQHQTKKSLFAEFSRVFQFGKMAVKYEREKYTVKKAWDAKVPKQDQFAAVRFELPPAPMPDHLVQEPNAELHPDDERKVDNSRYSNSGGL
ncbi:unnamed protein product [Amoebophrya sp. A120]|nr:unnamed protein product [Amoebophrya sp. A120]|eukprot:GSA120T00006294001.1